MNGNRDLLVLYKGEMIADQMPDTLEKLYPEENPPAKQKAKPEPVVEEKEEEEEAQGSLFS